MQQKHGGHRGECGAHLQREDGERPPRASWKPPDREESDEGQLTGHQELPDVRRGPFIGLTRRAGEDEMNEHSGKRGE